jgi:hypothetical protein
MIETTSSSASDGGVRQPQTNASNGLQAKSFLTKIAAFIVERNIAFLVTSIGFGLPDLLYRGELVQAKTGIRNRSVRFRSPLCDESQLT